jgi:hypothetical protein
MEAIQFESHFSKENLMTNAGCLRLALFGTAAIAALGATNEPNAQPNPYSTVENYFKMPEENLRGGRGQRRFAQSHLGGRAVA